VLDKHIAIVEVLARSPALEAGDLTGVRARLDDLLAHRMPGANFLVLRPDGQQRLNTSVAPGVPLPRRQYMEVTRRAVATRRPAVSDIFPGAVTGKPVLAIDVPVVAASGDVVSVLSLNPPVSVFSELIHHQGLPAGWFVVVYDRQGVIVARDPGDEQYAGRPVTRPVLAQQREGIFETTSREGVPIVAAFAHSAPFGWGVLIGVPRAAISGPAVDDALYALAIGLLALLLSVVLALVLTRQISRPMLTLRRLAAASGPELAHTTVTTGLPEADEVVQTLRTTEQYRQLSEQSFRHLFDNSPLSKWVYDPKTLRFVAVNDTAVETYGYSREEFLAMTLHDVFVPEDWERMMQGAANPPVRQHTTDWHNRYKDGRIVDVEIVSHAITFNGRPARIIEVIDVTERKAAEALLIQAQKMEAVGQLTGGLAHDFNNLLGVIIGNAGLLEDGPNDPRFAEYVREIKAAARRGGALTRSLLAFARRQPLRPVRIDPNHQVAEMTALLRRLLGERIEIVLDLAPSVWPVMVDPVQLESSLTNLATNARDAMPKGGRLTIRTANRHLDEAYAAQHPEVRPGDYVLIEVGDSGTGIAPEHLGKVFEPFFSTKARGEGTGLGLSMVFGFIKQSGGNIDIYSELGIGTTFRLYLPRDRGPLGAVEDDRAGTAPTGRGERVLVVEDDVALRRTAVRQLEQLGYRAAEAASGAEALGLIEASVPAQAPFDLVFTDVVMAGKVDGFDLARAVAERWPRIAIVMTSGFPAQIADRHAAQPPPNVRLLGKPYQKEELARAVREALDARR
ncbi:MAG TPA: ATP-binding protein, partial [Candidatus Sulfotelmatobacter sp.]|nr:ATP-binding protein [Candidatus Sulfotelmatobacter sp.]